MKYTKEINKTITSKYERNELEMSEKYTENKFGDNKH